MDWETLKKNKSKTASRLLLVPGYILFSLIITMKNMNPTNLIMQNKILNLNISYSPLAVILGIIILILYIGYRWIRDKFIGIWIGTKIFSFSIHREKEVETQHIRDKFSYQKNSYGNVGRLD